MVECKTCNKKYKSFSEGQAEGCSADLYLKDGTHYIIGSYGSRVADMQKYMLKSSTEYELGPICDECITKLIDQKVAVLIADGIW